MSIKQFLKNPAMLSKMLSKIMINRQKGQSLAELIIAMAIFAIIGASVVFLILGSHKSNLQSQQISQAILVNQEGLEAVKSVGHQNWTDLKCFSDADPDNNGRGLDSSAGYWQLEDEGTDDFLYNKYTRTVGIFQLYRNPDGQIVEDDGNGINIFDPYLRKVVATTTWPQTIGSGQNEITYTSYLSNWTSRDFIDTTQANFSAGTPDANITVNADGSIQLTETAGTYAKTGTFISQPLDTGVAEPAYNFISWQYSWQP